MVNVPSARKYGLARLDLHDSAMAELLNSSAVTQFVSELGEGVRADVETHVRATVSAEHADNYAASLRAEDSDSDTYGFDFDGPYALGNRPITVVGIPSGRGSNPNAMPPLMVEARTHALTSVPGFMAGGGGEDIR